MNPIEERFDTDAPGLGWKCLSTGWPDRLVFKSDGSVMFVEIKSERDPIRPNQLRMLKALQSLGFKVFISVGGDVSNLVEADEWPTSSSNLGRPVMIDVGISRSTARVYAYKARKLAREIEELKKSPNVSEERLEELTGRLREMHKKTEQFWGKDLKANEVIDLAEEHEAGGPRAKRSSDLLAQLEKEIREEDEKRKLAAKRFIDPTPSVCIMWDPHKEEKDATTDVVEET